MNLRGMSKEELELLKTEVDSELENKSKEDRYSDGFDGNRIVSPEECPDVMTRLIHNRNALPNDANAMNAMITVRKERLDAIAEQDRECLRRMMGKRY